MRRTAAGAALLLALTPGVARAGARAAVVEGPLVAMHADDFARGRSADWWEIRAPGGRAHRVRFEGAAPPAGSIVRATGERRSGEIAVRSWEVLAPRSTAPVLGQKRVAVVLLNFADDDREPFTPEQVRTLVFGADRSVAAFYREDSYGQIDLVGRAGPEGDVYGWYTLDASSAGCDYSGWAAAARTEAAEQGAAVAGYDHYVWVFPYQASCGWGGLGELGLQNSWINGIYGRGVYAHELGHNLGVHHASSLECTDPAGARVALGTGCGRVEYGDPFDVMGHGSRALEDGTAMPLQHNVFFKRQIGWVPDASVARVEREGTYTLGPAETGTGVIALEIPVSPGRWGADRSYVLEYRQRIGLDAFDPAEAGVHGIAIRSVPLVAEATQSALIDTTPETRRTATRRSRTAARSPIRRPACRSRRCRTRRTA